MKVTIVVGVSAAYWRCFDSVLNIDQINELAGQIAKEYEAKGNKVVYSVSDGDMEFRLNETKAGSRGYTLMIHYHYAIVHTEHFNDGQAQGWTRKQLWVNPLMEATDAIWCCNGCGCLMMTNGPNCDTPPAICRCGYSSCSDTVLHYDGSTSNDIGSAQPGDTIMHYDGSSEVK